MTAQWLDAMAAGSATMSQRKLSWLERRGGGIEAVKAAAERRGVHLLLIEDDKGEQIVVATLKPVRLIC